MTITASTPNMWLLDTLSCLLLSCPSTERTSERTLERTLDKTPVVCWHGVNDDADSCSGLLSTLPSDVYTVSVQLGQSLEQDKYNSVFLGMMDQVKAGCELLAGDPLLESGYHAVGLSQGGLLLRGVVQLCPVPPVRTLVTVGSPHQGEAGAGGHQ